MNNTEKIYATLNGQAEICDDCLSIITNITPRQSVNKLCRKSMESGELNRVKGECVKCNKPKIINRLLIVTPVEKQTNQAITKKAVVNHEKRFIQGKDSLDLASIIPRFVKTIKSGEIEIYNEFSLQHEIGIFFRESLPNKTIQFERNVSFFGFKKSEFIKKEIDIVIYDKSSNEIDVTIELKFPRSGRYPECMYDFCKDIVFSEQLYKKGFNKSYSIIFVDNSNYYRGKRNGIYKYFRYGTNDNGDEFPPNVLHGDILKPTGSSNERVTIEGAYTIEWRHISKSLYYAIVEVGLT